MAKIKKLTVADLVKELSKFPPDSIVYATPHANIDGKAIIELFKFRSPSEVGVFLVYKEEKYE